MAVYHASWNAETRSDQAAHPQAEKSRRLVTFSVVDAENSASAPFDPSLKRVGVILSTAQNPSSDAAMKIVFCGTPAFALPALQQLIAEPDFLIQAVITQPDRPRGRGNQVSVSPIKQAALEAGLEVFQPEKIRHEPAYEFLKTLDPDAIVIIAYGQIIPARLIAIPRLGWINLHASLLPHYRGAAPINWAILNGETRTGVTTMQIDPGLDTGPTLMKTEIEIGADETAPELAARLSQAGAPLMAETLRKLNRGEIVPMPQDNSRATFAPPLKKEDGHIDWAERAQKIYNRIRALQPWPGTFTAFRGQLCHIWGRPASETTAGLAPSLSPGSIIATGKQVLVACGHGTFLQLEYAQLEGRKRITAQEFANGARLQPGERFGI
jgi:methionyl-tRNA formyltransferase